MNERERGGKRRRRVGKRMRGRGIERRRVKGRRRGKGGDRPSFPIIPNVTGIRSGPILINVD